MMACMLQGCACKHQYKAATCTEPSKCELCGETQGVELGHDFSAATCTTPSTCRRCNITTGTTLNHKYKEATCSSPKKCTSCGQTVGTSLSHNYSEATCTTAKKCKVCGNTSGSALGHNFNGATCLTCGAKNPRYEELKTILSEMSHDVSYVSSYVGTINTSITLLNNATTSSRKQAYCEDIRDDIISIEKCLSRIREKCLGVKELETLYEMTIIEVPEFSGTFSSYKNKANYYKVQADHVVSMYNACCNTYK